MSNTKYNALLTGLLCVALGGCSSMQDRGASTDTSDLYGSSSLATPRTTGTMDTTAQSSGTGASSMNPTASPSTGSSTSSQMSSQTSSPTSSQMNPQTSSPASSSMSPGATGTTTGQVTGTADGSATSATTQAGMATYGVVQSIDQVPRSQVASAELSASGLSTSAGSSTGGSSAGASDSGTSSASDMVYRVMVRLDDGTMRPAYQESRPAYQIGDRVRMANGMVLRY